MAQSPVRSGGIVLAAAALQAALFIGLVARVTILRPFRDMITWIDAYLQRAPGSGWLAYLWQPHNEHHLVLIRLLTALSVAVFHGEGVPFVAAATAATLATTWLVLRELRLMLPAPYRALAWLGAMLLLTTAAVADCAIPINSVYPLALLFIVAAVALFDGESERTARTNFRRALACCMAVLASFASGVGMVAWPALLWACWRGGARPPWTMRIALFAAVYGVLYMRDLPPLGLGHGPVGVLPAAKLATYALTYLGLPLSRAPGLHWPARLLGGVLLVAGSAAIARGATARELPSRGERFAVALVVAGLSGGILATLGRSDLTPDVEVPLRYAVMVAPLHIGLFMLALRYLIAVVPPRRLLAGGGGFAVTLLALQATSAPAIITASDAIAATLDRYDAGVREPGMRLVIFPDLKVADRVMGTLQRK